MVKKSTTDPLKIELSADELKALGDRLRASNLSKSDQQLMFSVLSAFIQIRTLLSRRTSRLLSILRTIFGLKTEKRQRDSARDDDDPEADKKGSGGGGSPGGNKPGKGGRGNHGRNGLDDYPGAKKVKCQHADLSPNDNCPECQVGHLIEDKPSKHYHWMGQSPVALTIYLLQRLVCDRCKAVFKAPLPEEVAREDEVRPTSEPAVGDSVSPEAKCHPSRSTMHGRERTYAVSADVSVALMRYQYGVPSFRLARIQESQGIPLPEGTQWAMIMRPFPIVATIYRALWYLAAQGAQFFNDDTGMKVLSLMGKHRERGPPQILNKDGSERKKVQTTCMLSKVVRQTIVLYVTGHKNAGENLDDLLAVREAGLAVPRQMCDGLSQSVPTDQETIMGNCLDHGRRKFYDCLKSDQNCADHVLELLAQVYAVDKKTRDLSPEERLATHQEKSAPIMAKLEEYLDEIYDTLIEPNSAFGSAIKYMKKRWLKLTLFLRVAGAPIANSECERAIKRAIPHRKGSLFFKNLKGAYVGDAYMSVIQTSQATGANALAYLSQLQIHADRVRRDPLRWLPWNYLDNPV